MDEILNQMIEIILTEKNENFIIGISGHGASGKTTFAKKLIECLNLNINYLNTDPYIITDVRSYTQIDYESKGEKHSFKMTACHPHAHNLLALTRDVKMIQNNLAFYTIETDYMTSNLISSQNHITIVEGMSVAFLDSELFDLTIYLHTDGETELSRRSIRDAKERGRDLNTLQNTFKHRRIQYELFMHPKSQNFDIIIKNDAHQWHIEKTI